MKIIKETPAGVIDGVNTHFTLLNEVEFIDDVFMDGVIYTDFKVVGKTLILDDAPILSIKIDYKAKDYVDNDKFDTSITLGKIISEIYNLTGQTPNSTNFNRDRVVRMINSVCDRVWKGKITNLLNPSQIFKASALEFSLKNTGYRIALSGVLSESLSVGDIEVNGGFSHLFGAGLVKIGSDLVSYTNNNKTTLSGLTGITVNHFSGDSVKQLYELPIDFLRIEKISKIIHNKNLEIKDNYRILNHKGKNYIDFDFLLQNTEILVEYRSKYTPMFNDNDLCIFPDNYGIDVIANLVAGELMYQRNMPNGQVLLNNGYSYLQNMYQEFESKRKPEINYIKAKRRGRI